MNKLMIIILVISLIGNCIGLLIIYKYMNLKGYFSDAEAQLRESNAALKGMHKLIADMTARLDSQASERLIFLHHSVGQGILMAGGLRDQLLNMGVLVKSATYGDDIGQETDMNNWAEKFGQHMNEILAFKAHPNLYNTDGTTNDYIMFKSCFPNSDIIAEGTLPGDPNSPEKTITNYKAVFEQLKADMRKYPNKLFIYLTAPPLTPDLSSPENAARARTFNNWLINDFLPQYQSETGLENFVIFDLFNCLAGPDNYLKPEYRRGIKGDPHPNALGSKEAAEQIAQFFKTVRDNWRFEK